MDLNQSFSLNNLFYKIKFENTKCGLFIKEAIHPKQNMIFLFTRPHAVPDVYTYTSSVEYKLRFLE